MSLAWLYRAATAFRDRAGEKEETDKTVAVRKRGEGDMGAIALKEFIAKAEKEIMDKK
ncbi:MAG: hypothetical protein V1928_00970 [Parcubacteria group bacterium]